jgi:hypothetical protein
MKHISRNIPHMIHRITQGKLKITKWQDSKIDLKISTESKIKPGNTSEIS